MVSIVRKMVEIFSKGNGSYRVDAKTKFDVEGTQIEELLRQVAIAGTAVLSVTVSR